MPKSTKGPGAAKPVTITPFADEVSSTSFGDLTIENRLDRVSLYGSLDLTRDRRGLDDARRLQALLAKVVEVLEHEGNRLPDKDQSKPNVTQARNPFG
jgi:inhibitor of KinA sporulation pathway (predicted exonuclease)